jgi:hypothetical protein
MPLGACRWKPVVENDSFVQKGKFNAIVVQKRVRITAKHKISQLIIRNENNRHNHPLCERIVDAHRHEKQFFLNPKNMSIRLLNSPTFISRSEPLGVSTSCQTRAFQTDF